MIKATQTSGSAFAARIEQVQKKKFEQEFIKNVDFFLHGYGS